MADSISVGKSTLYAVLDTANRAISSKALVYAVPVPTTGNNTSKLNLYVVTTPLIDGTHAAKTAAYVVATRVYNTFVFDGVAWVPLTTRSYNNNIWQDYYTVIT